ncbi:MAG: LysM peptidoglycan-binding domain-containing protein, partial [bacterium]|nr:LysM peptidoglycan-binding domain-containing protein [bacterium]
MSQKRFGFFLIAAAVLAFLGFTARAQDGKTTHTVVLDETLHGIAEQYLGNPASWPIIYNANKDKIEDPHWIYPGQELVIPLTPEAMAAAPDTSKVITPAAVDTTPVQVQAAPEPEPEPEPQTAGPVKITGGQVVVRKLIVPVVSEELVFSSGYITAEEEKPLAYINGADKPISDYLMPNDIVYITAGSNSGLNAGDTLTIYRIGGKNISHPQTGQKLGKIVTIVGLVQMTEVGPQSGKAKIIRSMEAVSRKEMLKRYQKFNVPKVTMGDPMLAVAKTPEGFIVATKSPIEAATAYRVVFLDKGTDDGIGIGDI